MVFTGYVLGTSCFFMIEDRVGKKSKILLLLICGVIQLYFKLIPLDFFYFQKGMSYIFWLALGYYWSDFIGPTKVLDKMTVLYGIIIGILVYGLDFKYNLLNKFFTICIATIVLLLLSEVIMRTSIVTSGLFKLILRNSFYIYIFHDPLEYIVLRLAFDNNWLNTDIGCYIYWFLRIFGVIIVSIGLGECIKKINGYIVSNKLK